MLLAFRNDLQELDKINSSLKTRFHDSTGIYMYIVATGNVLYLTTLCACFLQTNISPVLTTSLHSRLLPCQQQSPQFSTVVLDPRLNTV